MGPERLDLVIVLAVYAAATWAAFWLPVGQDARLALPARLPAHPVRWLRGHRRRRRAAAPAGRPLEQIASDARRLAPRAMDPPRGTSRAKVIALRYAYDHVLAEACAALGIEHLLAVLPPGDELDAERTRVEGLLWLAGLRIDQSA
jgi:hypothetical protein